MTNKIKLMFPVLALGLLMVGGTIYAATTTTPISETKAVTPSTPSAKSTCITSAKTARATAIKTANDTMKQAKVSAKTAKDEAI